MSGKSEYGIVGYFDILGYKSFLDNNPSLDKSVTDVLAIIDKTPQEVSEFWKGFQPADSPSHFRDIRWLVVSDSIIGTLACDAKSGITFAELTAFLVVASMLSEKMFRHGLSVRGTITYGEYITVRTKTSSGFAGRPFVMAYEAAQCVDMAGVVIVDNDRKCEQIIKEIRDDKTKLHLIYDYKVPLKGGGAKPMLILNTALGLFHEPNMYVVQNFPKNCPNLREAVIQSFGAYKKDITPEMYSKVDNTEVLLQFLKGRNPSAFE